MSDTATHAGLVHVYTGDGKGKTTAALGLVLRAVGRGWRVHFVQFLKGAPTGEASVLEQLPGVSLRRPSEKYSCFFQDLSSADQDGLRAEHNALLLEAIGLANSGEVDLLVLDEAAIAYYFDALDRDLLDGFLADRLLSSDDPSCEVVLTGRYAPDSFLVAADYLTVMTKVKHPYDLGQEEREGIEL